MSHTFSFEKECYFTIEIGERSEGSSYIGSRTRKYNLSSELFAYKPSHENQYSLAPFNSFDLKQTFEVGYEEDDKYNVIKFLNAMRDAPGFEVRAIVNRPGSSLDKRLFCILIGCSIIKLIPPSFDDTQSYLENGLIIKCVIDFSSAIKASDLEEELSKK